jgi:ArsR family metal-binding transcriptional regulator
MPGNLQPLDIYRKLPHKNCGKCSAGMCMDFAVHYLRRMVSLSECVELDEESIKEIEEMTSGEKE